MKPILFILVFCMINIAYAQTGNPKTVKVTDKRIYLIFENNQLSFFTAKITPDGKDILTTNSTLWLTDNSVNIYLKWINPLKYKVSWTDSTLVDKRDQALKDFITSLTGQFGSSVTNLNNNSTMQLLVEKAILNTPALAAGAPTLDMPKFNSYLLTSMYLQLKQNSSLTPDDINTINAVTKNLTPLDQNSATGLAQAALSDFNDMFNATDPTKVSGITDNAQNDVSVWQAAFKTIADQASTVTKSLDMVKLSDSNLENLFKTGVLTFIDKVNVQMAANQKIVIKLSPLIAVMQNSVADGSAGYPGYFKIKNESFVDGKMVQSKLILSEYQFNTDTYDFSKKSDVLTLTLNFQKYDKVNIFVSTGVFFSNTTLKSYGVATSGTQFTVSETDISNNNAVTALFCNFAFGDSRYFSPLVQLGIDPTKKNPFLLAGAGFVIPSTHFAISGGPIWTWDQSLKTLSVGSTVASTSALTSDIKSTFNAAPKGYYLGIQYNF